MAVGTCNVREIDPCSVEGGVRGRTPAYRHLALLKEPFSSLYFLLLCTES